MLNFWNGELCSSGQGVQGVQEVEVAGIHLKQFKVISWSVLLPQLLDWSRLDARFMCRSLNKLKEQCMFKVGEITARWSGGLCWCFKNLCLLNELSLFLNVWIGPAVTRIIVLSLLAPEEIWPPFNCHVSTDSEQQQEASTFTCQHWCYSFHWEDIITSQDFCVRQKIKCNRQYFITGQ